MNKNESPIVLSYVIQADAISIWSALTELKEMKQWYFEQLPDFKAEVGFEVTFDVASENTTFPHHWTVTEVMDNKKIVYNWNYIGFDGDAYMTFEIVDKGASSELHLKMDIVESFDSDTYPEFKADSCIGGWNYFMDRLKNYLAEGKR
jgi:uncharacterized protein YndB with AHSA1/START domain